MPEHDPRVLAAFVAAGVRIPDIERVLENGWSTDDMKVLTRNFQWSSMPDFSPRAGVKSLRK